MKLTSLLGMVWVLMVVSIIIPAVLNINIISVIMLDQDVKSKHKNASIHKRWQQDEHGNCLYRWFISKNTVPSMSLYKAIKLDFSVYQYQVLLYYYTHYHNHLILDTRLPLYAVHWN